MIILNIQAELSTLKLKCPNLTGKLMKIILINIFGKYISL
jgi:hypothetical protein